MLQDSEQFPESYSSAVAIGAKHYFTGRACSNGHVSKRLTSSRQCVDCHADCVSRARRDYPEKSREMALRYTRDNRDAVNRRRREAYHEDLETSRSRQRARRAANPERFREYEARYRANAGRKIHKAISEGVRRSLLSSGKAGRGTFKLLGYSKCELMSHLEKQFHSGICWENYGEWHIDHIIPMSAFNFITSEDIDFKRCWAMSNLQPMWGPENQSKGAKLYAAFQPSLAFGAHANDNSAPTSVGAA